MKSILLVIVLIVTSITFGQNMEIKGRVMDTYGEKPVENSVIMAVRLSDSVLLGHTRSDADGYFDLEGVVIDTFELIVTHPNFSDKSYFIFGSEESSEINIPSVSMPDKAQEIAEVNIIANKESIYFKGDTMVYIADSFATRANANVEDLLKKLPGLKVNDDGSISSQGKNVSKVLVDGDEFFGADPTIATRNLGAEGVATVEVYEAENEDAQDGEDSKIQVLDVRLKDGYKKGYFGKISAASDFQKYYEGEILANYFNKDLKVSVFGLGANTPKSSFGFRDAYRFGLTNEMSGNRWGGFSFGNQGSSSGIPQTFKGGFYFTNKIGKNTELGANYTYNNRSTVVDERQTSTYSLADTSYSANERNYLDQLTETHAINFTLETKLDSLTKLVFKPSVNLSKNNSFDADSTSYYARDNSLQSTTNVTNENNADGMDVNSDIKITRAFKSKAKRELSLRYKFGLTDNTAESFLKSNITYLNGGGINDTVNQFKNTTSYTVGHRGELEFVEPLSRKVKLKFSYRFDYFNGTQEKSTFNFDNGSYSDFDSTFSNKFENTQMENRLGASYNLETNKQTFIVGSNFRNINIDNYNVFSDSTINQNVNNILPYLTYAYKFSNSHRIRFNYNTDANQPNLSQLAPVRDNTNPNNIYIGNPDLRPSYTHSVNLNHNIYQALKQQYFFSGLYASYTQNAMSNNITYLPDGRTISQSVNVDDNFYAGFYFGGGIPVFKQFLKIEPSLNGNYSNTESFINSQLNNTKNLSASAGLNFEIDRDSIGFELGGELTYNNPTSTINFFNNQPYYTYDFSASFFIDLPWKMSFETDADYQINSNRGTGYNINIFLLDFTLSKRFTERENWILSFELNDALNQNTIASRVVRNNVIIDNQSTIISRYWLAKLTWKFNNTKTKEEDVKWH